MRWIAWAMVLGLAACHGAKDDAPPAPPVDAATLSLVEAAGDRALAVVVVRYDRWQAVHAALQPVVANLPAPVKPVFELAKDPLATLPPAGKPLEGWDRARPIVLALAEAPRSAPPGALSPLLERSPPMPLRHRALVPASDAAKLTARLAEVALAMGLAAEDAVTGGRPGARGFRGPDGVFVALFPEEGRVRVEVAQGAATPPILAEAPSAAPPKTPALLAAATGDEAVLLHVRPWHLRAVSTWWGQRNVAEALASVDPSYKTRIAQAGMAELLTGELVMDGEGADFDDRVVALGAVDGALEVRAVTSLTPQGAAVLAAGAEGAKAAFFPLKREVTAELNLRLDVGAMLDRAEVPPAYASAKGLHDLMEAFREGGVATFWHASERMPFGLAKKIKTLAEGNSGPLPVGPPRLVQLALVEWTERRRPRFAAAFVLQKEADGAALQKLFGESSEATLTLAKRGDDAVALVGVGVDPATVFDVAGRAAQAEIARGTIRLHGLAAPAPGAAGALLAAKRVDFVSDVRGRALASAVRVLLAAPETPLAAPAAPDAGAWASPVDGAPATGSAKCLRGAARSLVKGIGAVAQADPAQRAMLQAAVVSEVRADLSCALADAETKPAAEALRANLLDGLFDERDLDWEPQRAATMAELACALEDAARCARLKAAGTRAPVELPAVSARCDTEAAGARLLVDGERLLLDGRPPTPEVLAAAAKEGTPQLAATPMTPFSAVRPHLAALRAAGVDQVTLLARAPDGRVARVPLRLVGAEAPAPRDPLLRTIAEGPRRVDLEPVGDTAWRDVVDQAAGACPAAAITP